jgi:hypothetical protein
MEWRVALHWYQLDSPCVVKVLARRSMDQARACQAKHLQGIRHTVGKECCLKERKAVHGSKWRAEKAMRTKVP